MFNQLALNYNKSLNTFTPYPSITDRNSWDGLSPDLTKDIIEAGSKYLNYSYPSLSPFLTKGEAT